MIPVDRTEFVEAIQKIDMKLDLILQILAIENEDGDENKRGRGRPPKDRTLC